MLCSGEEAPVLRAWRGLASGDLDRRDVVVLRSVVAGSAHVRASGLRGLERDQLVDDVVRRLWRSAARQGPRWLDRARSNVNPEVAVRSYIASAARSELIDRLRSGCGENTDLEVVADEPVRDALREWVPTQLWSDILDPAEPEVIADVVEERTLALLRPLTDEKERSLLRFRIRCRLAAPSQLPALASAYLTHSAAAPHASPPSDLELRRRRNALDVAMTRFARRLWARLDAPGLKPDHRRRCRRVVHELFGGILRRPALDAKNGGETSHAADQRVA
jgi:hypothetical protein